MGVSESKDQYMTLLARLSMKSYDINDPLWTSILASTTNQSEFVLPYPRLLNEVALKYPQNLINLMTYSYQHLTMLNAAESKTEFPIDIVNQLHLNLNIFRCCTEVLIYNSFLTSLLKYIENGLGDQYIVIKNEMKKIAYEATKHEENSKPSNEDSNQNENSKPALQSPQQASPQVEQHNPQNEQSNIDQDKLNAINFVASQCNGKIITSYIRTISQLLFKKGLTIEADQEIWTQSSFGNSLFSQARFDIVHALLFFASPNFFLPSTITIKTLSIPFFDFPHKKFIESVCQLSSRYNSLTFLERRNEQLSKPLRNCIILSIRLFENCVFQSSISNMDSEKILIAFYDTNNPIKPTFGPLYPYASELITFFFMLSYYHPTFGEFLSKENKSNDFIHQLLDSSQYSHEKTGVTYIHNIIISSLINILMNEGAAKELNNPCLDGFSCNFKPHNGSYADVLFEFLLNLVPTSKYILTKFAFLFYIVSEFVYKYLVSTATKVIQLFKQCVKDNNSYCIDMLLKGFVKMIQNECNKENGFLIVIVKETKYFKKLLEEKEENSNELNLILKFNKTVISKFKKYSKVGSDEFGEVIDGVDVDEIFPKKTKFERVSCDFETGIQWQKWGDYFMKELFEQEIYNAASFKEEVKYLVQKDAQDNGYAIDESEEEEKDEENKETKETKE
ncbi:hypothetical protein GPJ56_004667 [Histomonas meleagridis]|uniref:uncharacterized protein n=1 Tax=Histomonas meleagridis TaxID=135588 RepID=UPI0035594502|nr:hypothetical protein GPJ56_004667 [Histomonas meleagridis]KAH0797428.1 hypothetical protein GO595_009749 [Histomonas meleagridis]